MFSALIHNALDESCYGCPYALSEDDYHLALCAMQGGAWEAAREAHSCAADILITQLAPGAPVTVWKRCLGNWRTNMSVVTQPHQTYFNPPSGLRSEYTLTPISLILWHISSLKISAPMDFLGIPGNYLNRRSTSAASVQLQSARAHVLAWMPRECSRAALWNAAQICRIVERERSVRPAPSTRLLLNPLALPGVLMSAVVTLTWANMTRKCGVCTGSQHPVVSVDLFETDEKDDMLLKWRETGELLAIWGSEQIVICQCQLQVLASWFRGHLAPEVVVQFESFLAELTKV